MGWAPETEEEQIQMTIYSQILVVHYILQAKRERILHASSIGTPVLSELDEWDSFQLESRTQAI